MIKSELIAKIAEQNPHLYKRDAEAIVDAILDTITAALARGDRSSATSVFTAKKRPARHRAKPARQGCCGVGESLARVQEYEGQKPGQRLRFKDGRLSDPR